MIFEAEVYKQQNKKSPTHHNQVNKLSLTSMRRLSDEEIKTSGT